MQRVQQRGHNYCKQNGKSTRKTNLLQAMDNRSNPLCWTDEQREIKPNNNILNDTEQRYSVQYKMSKELSEMAGITIQINTAGPSTQQNYEEINCLIMWS